MNAPGSRPGRGFPWRGSLVRKRWRCLFKLIESEAEWGSKMGKQLPQCTFPRMNTDPGWGAGTGGWGALRDQSIKAKQGREPEDWKGSSLHSDLGSFCQ